MIDAAAQKQHLAFGSSTIGRIVKDVAITILGNIPAVQKKLQVELSETEVVYRGGPLVALAEPPRRAKRTGVGARARDAMLVDPGTGQQIPLWPRLCELRHTLLLFEDTHRPIPTHGISEGTGDRLQIHPHRSEARSPSMRCATATACADPAGFWSDRTRSWPRAEKGPDLTALNRYLERVLRIGGSGRSAGSATVPLPDRAGGSAKRAAV